MDDKELNEQDLVWLSAMATDAISAPGTYGARHVNSLGRGLRDAVAEVRRLRGAGRVLDVIGGRGAGYFQAVCERWGDTWLKNRDIELRE